jgi:cell division protein FtsQ
MDDRGRLAQPLTQAQHWRRTRRAFRRFIAALEFHVPRGAGIAAASAFFLATSGYGAVRGGHVDVVVGHVKDARDLVANAAGLRIATIALGGQKQITREEILAIAGVTGRSSLLFLDADDARLRLKAHPWIADATVLKLYPDRLHITVSERQVFALWQKDGRVSVIAADGVVVEPYVAAHSAHLPLVVGAGAETQASEFLSRMDRYLALRDEVAAYVLVAERRWNLKLKNGLMVRLPEFDTDRAIETVLMLDRDKKLLSRDIASVDLRVPDRVTVRLSDDAALARAEALKDKKTKRKGSDA